MEKSDGITASVTRSKQTVMPVLLKVEGGRGRHSKYIPELRAMQQIGRLRHAGRITTKLDREALLPLIGSYDRNRHGSICYLAHSSSEWSLYSARICASQQYRHYSGNRYYHFAHYHTGQSHLRRTISPAQYRRAARATWDGNI